MKSVALMSRKPGMTRADFRDYYEKNHTVLGMRYFEFRKYIRNHVVEPPEGAFDVFSEFWQADIPKVYAAMAGPIGDLMRKDGSKFIDRSQQRLANAVETLIAGAPRGVDPTPTPKTSLFLTMAPGADRSHFLDAVARWGAEIAEAAPDEIRRVTMDIIAPFENAPFPYDAIICLWHRKDAADIASAPPKEVVLAAKATLESCETPPDVLSKSYMG